MIRCQDLATALVSLLVFLCIADRAAAQDKAITHDGRVVLLFNDGTWRFETPTTPSKAEVPNGDCASWLEETTDKMTGTTTVSGKGMVLVSNDGGKTGFGIITMLGGNSESVILSIQAVGAGACIDEGNRINILFRDGTRMELASQSDFNCEARATVYFGGVFGKTAELRKLSAEAVETIRVWTSGSYVERDLTVENSTQLLNSIKCLMERLR